MRADKHLQPVHSADTPRETRRLSVCRLAGLSIARKCHRSPQGVFGNRGKEQNTGREQISLTLGAGKDLNRKEEKKEEVGVKDR